MGAVPLSGTQMRPHGGNRKGDRAKLMIAQMQSNKADA